jgi:hypothetical protein
MKATIEEKVTPAAPEVMTLKNFRTNMLISRTSTASCTTTVSVAKLA